MISFEVNGKKYQARDLDVFDQMIIAKRLMPVLKNIVTPEVLGAAMSAQPQEGSSEPANKLDASKMLSAIADAIYALSDEDTKAIMQMTLRVVDVQNAGSGAFSPLMAPTGGLMFKDLKLPDLLQISWKVIEGNLGDFFSTAP